MISLPSPQRTVSHAHINFFQTHLSFADLDFLSHRLFAVRRQSPGKSRFKWIRTTGFEPARLEVGKDLKYFEAARAEHDERAWAARFKSSMEFLFPKKQ